jgi:ribosome-binding protein aMBF1 (putative translation factor)
MSNKQYQCDLCGKVMKGLGYGYPIKVFGVTLGVCAVCNKKHSLVFKKEKQLKKLLSNIYC